MTTIDIIAPSSYPWVSNAKPRENHAQLAADLDAEQKRQDWDCARTEECTELSGRENSGIQEAASKYQTSNPNQNEHYAGGRFQQSQ
jgi:hypothetical protein